MKKHEFLEWLKMYAHIPPTFLRTIEHHHFSEAEIELLRRHVIQDYRLKKEFLGRRAGA